MTNNQFIKGAYTESEYTPELIQELLKCQKDPVYFIRNYVYLQHPTRGRILFNLYDYQEEIVRICHENKRVIMLIPRQMGKCSRSTTLINTMQKPSRFKLWVLSILDKVAYQNVKTVFNL